MPSPVDKAAQEAESAERTRAGVETTLNAAAAEPIGEDAPRGDPLEGQAAQPKGEQEISTPPPPRGENPNITKRNEIASRWRTERLAREETERDELSDFMNTGAPPEFEAAAPEEPGAEPGQEPVEPPAPAPAPRPQTVRVKVRGVEKDITLDEAIAEAQKSLAGESYLEEGRNKLKEIEALERDIRSKVSPARTGQDGEHHADPNATQTSEEQPPAAEGAPAPGSPYTKLVEALSFGDPAEAENLLATTIAEETAKRVRQELLAARLRDEGARSQQTLKDFVDQHADLAADPRAEAVIQREVYDLQVEDLKAIGRDPSKMTNPKTGLPLTASDVAEAHKYYRSEGFAVRTPKVLLEKAVEGFLAWKGVPTTTPPSPADPNSKAAPRIELSAERSARRAAIPQQPSRTGVPARAPTAAVAPKPIEQRRAEAVAAMMNRRNLPRGKIATG
jgi:hypothetical protein